MTRLIADNQWLSLPMKRYNPFLYSDFDNGQMIKMLILEGSLTSNPKDP